MGEKEKLLRTIDQASFAMDDTRLFLDTHPDCREAIDFFNKAKKVRETAMNEYTMKFGPLTSYGASNCDSWKWNQGPFPWEGGNC